MLTSINATILPVMLRLFVENVDGFLNYYSRMTERCEDFYMHFWHWKQAVKVVLVSVVL